MQSRCVEVHWTRRTGQGRIREPLHARAEHQYDRSRRRTTEAAAAGLPQSAAFNSAAAPRLASAPMAAVASAIHFVQRRASRPPAAEDLPRFLMPRRGSLLALSQPGSGGRLGCAKAATDRPQLGHRAGGREPGFDRVLSAARAASATTPTSIRPHAAGSGTGVGAKVG
jgi:hypothetical protein